MAEYTISSDDVEHYNRIYSYFEPLGTLTATMTVTGLTTQCCIRILKGIDNINPDWIKINGYEYQFPNDHTQLNHESFVDVLNNLDILDMEFSLDYCKRLIVKSQLYDIEINDASYNVRLLMGVHPFDKLELFEEWFEGYVTTLTIPTIGFMLSTPVLYLTCNIGQKTYMNNQRSKYTQNSKIVMRLNNSFSANYPIIAGNAEFSTTVMSNDLTNVEFKLVDANMFEID